MILFRRVLDYRPYPHSLFISRQEMDLVGLSHGHLMSGRILSEAEGHPGFVPWTLAIQDYRGKHEFTTIYTDKSIDDTCRTSTTTYMMLDFSLNRSSL